MNFLRPALIIGTLPNTLANGQTADAVPLMADLNFIVNQVNANAAPLTNTALLNATNSFTQPQAGVSAAAVSQFPIVGDIITGGYQTLTSTLGTNTISARSTQIIPSSAQAGQAVFLIPSQTNTGPASLNRDNLGSFAILQLGSGLRSGELTAGIPLRLFFDGANYHVIGPSFRGGALTLFGDITVQQIQTPGNTALALGPGQLQFPATQNPSSIVNVLDDYEEGTWTPGVAFGGGVTGITYGAQTGTYTKIGRQVIATFRFDLTSKGSSAGSATITGLPFTIGSVGAVALWWGNMTTALVSMYGLIQSGVTTIPIHGATAASASQIVKANTDFSDTTAISGTISYHV